MATMDELRQQDYAKYIMPGYREMIDPKNVPTGQQLAPGLTQMQQDATALAKAGIGSYQPFLTAGAQALQAGQTALGPGGATAYMNPFISQVRDTTMKDLNRMFGQQTAAQQHFANQQAIANMQSGLVGQQYGLSNFQRAGLGADVGALGSRGSLRQGSTQAQL